MTENSKLKEKINMKFSFDVTEGESLLILMALKDLNENEERHELDRKDAMRLIQKLENQVHEQFYQRGNV